MSKENINLPKTQFSMKANLPAKEPGLVDHWKKINLYKKLRDSSKGKEKKFNNVNQLKSQIKKDLNIAKNTK